MNKEHVIEELERIMRRGCCYSCTKHLNCLSFRLDAIPEGCEDFDDDERYKYKLDSYSMPDLRD